jgi:hypothetical protein
MLPRPPHAERRRASRARRLRQARCIFNDGSSSLDVTLRDVSPTGARITGDALICLPPTFELSIHDGCGGYSARRARLVWVKGGSAGLKFVE